MLNNLNLIKSIHKTLPEHVIIKGGTIIDAFKGKEYKSDIEIKNGKIEKIAENIDSTTATVIDANGKYISQGFFDMHVHFREPGNEQAENIISGSNAAMAGGFTGVAMMPNTNPCIDNKFIFNDIKARCRNLLVDCHPIPAATVGRKGEVITEMAELVEAGALGFTDDGSGIQSAEAMRGALEYASMFETPVMVHSQDNTLFGGHMNESEVSTMLGMPAIPNLAEDIMIARDILILEYTGGKLHIQHVSTWRAIDIIRKAKKKGLNITCEVTPHHFSLTDEKVETFSTDYKMSPPLRSREDVDAILEGLKDGTIDAIATDHAPHAPEKKNVEFEFAPFGVIGLETALSAGIKFLVEPGILTLSELVKKLAVAPRQILNLEADLLEEGKNANIVVFDTDTEWTVDRFKMKSLARNTCYNGEEFKGKVHITINNGKIYM